MDPKFMTTTTDLNNNTTTAYPSSMSLYARYLTNKKSREARQQSSPTNETILPSSPIRSSSSSSSAASIKLAKKQISKLSASSHRSSSSKMATKINYLRPRAMQLPCLQITTATTLFSGLAAIILLATTCQAFLYQPVNYMLDDSTLVESDADNLDHASFSPIYNDQSGSSAMSADKDIATIIGEGLARWRDARMLNNQAMPAAAAPDELVASATSNQQNYNDNSQVDGQSENGPNVGEQPQSVSSAVAEMVLNGVSALASVASAANDGDANNNNNNNNNADGRQTNADLTDSPRHIMEVDTSAVASSTASEVSKADLKGTRQWYNPKDSIPALRISSMATPSKHKKVYFRSEKKLVDDSMDKSSLMKPFSGFGVQRRSSRGSSSPVAPQSLFQNGVIDFLRKFREVYIQTRPISTASGSSSAASSLASAASNMMVAAASSPAVASALSPSSSSSSSSGSKPGLASAASALSSAASSNGGLFGGASSGPNRSPLTPQKYMSFWSKQFPTWVRKVLKQIRRSTLKASQNKRQHQTSAIGQASAGASAAGIAENSAHNANQH